MFHFTLFSVSTCKLCEKLIFRTLHFEISRFHHLFTSSHYWVYPSPQTPRSCLVLRINRNESIFKMRFLEDEDRFYKINQTEISTSTKKSESGRILSNSFGARRNLKNKLSHHFVTGSSQPTDLLSHRRDWGVA